MFFIIKLKNSFKRFGEFENLSLKGSQEKIFTGGLFLKKSP
jgi:hypothetical protein